MKLGHIELWQHQVTIMTNATGTAIIRSHLPVYLE